MTIKLNEKEYRTLLDIAHIADAVVAGVHQQRDARAVQHRVLIRKLFSLAEQARPGASANGEIRPLAALQEFEESTVVHSFLDEFGTHLFWDELINKLTMRDAARIAGGIERLNAMNDGDREELEAPIRQRYIDEFTQYGLENILLVRGFVAAGAHEMKTSD